MEKLLFSTVTLVTLSLVQSFCSVVEEGGIHLHQLAFIITLQQLQLHYRL